MMRRVLAKLHNFSNLTETDILVSKIPLIQSVSRRMLEAVRVVLGKDTNMDTLSILFGSFKIHLPYSYIARRLMSAKKDETLYAKDAALLTDISHAINDMARTRVEVGPLAWAMRRLNTDVLVPVTYRISALFST